MGGNYRLFHNYYDIRKFRIEPLGAKDKKYISPLCFVANGETACINEEHDKLVIIDLDDENDCYERLGKTLLSILLCQNKTCRIMDIGLSGGEHVNYRVKVIDNKPEHITMGEELI